MHAVCALTHRSPTCANSPARVQLHCENDLAVVPGATPLFEELSALDAVAGLARG